MDVQVGAGPKAQLWRYTIKGEGPGENNSFIRFVNEYYIQNGKLIARANKVRNGKGKYDVFWSQIQSTEKNFKIDINVPKECKNVPIK